jgi:hypothetical protein
MNDLSPTYPLAFTLASIALLFVGLTVIWNGLPL